MATKWRLAKSLIRLRDQINQLAPHRSKVSDGSVGDTSHAARPSDHNPDSRGVVAAIDVTHDPVNGCDGQTLSRAVIADPRVKYVIYNSEIWKARTKKWERYTGPNAHKQHVHVSVKPDLYDNVAPWLLSVVNNPSSSSIKPILKLGDKGPEVRTLQSKLGIEVDGNFGFSTQRAVQRLQTKHGLQTDGIVGPKTWMALAGSR